MGVRLGRAATGADVSAPVVFAALPARPASALGATGMGVSRAVTGAVGAVAWAGLLAGGRAGMAATGSLLALRLGAGAASVGVAVAGA